MTTEINTFAAAAISGVNAAVISDDEKQRILDEETRQLEEMKVSEPARLACNMSVCEMCGMYVMYSVTCI